MKVLGTLLILKIQEDDGAKKFLLVTNNHSDEKSQKTFATKEEVTEFLAGLIKPQNPPFDIN